MSKNFMDKMREKKAPPPNAFIISPSGTVHGEYITNPPSPGLLEETIGPEYKVLEIPLTMPTPAGAFVRTQHIPELAEIIVSSGKVLLSTQLPNEPASVMAGVEVRGTAVLLLGEAMTHD